MAESIHLDRELLRAALQGELPLNLLRRIGLDHLLELCPHCRREVMALHAEVAGGVYNMTVTLKEVLKQQIPRLKQQHRAAEREMAELLALPPEKRIPKIMRSRRRFRSEHLIRLLLEASESRFTTDPAQARHLAELARAIIHYSPVAAGIYYELMALAAGFFANACRACGDLREADEQYKQVHYLVGQYAVSDPETLARLADLEASLRKDQRRFVQAERLLVRALTLYRLTSGREIPRVLLNVGDLFYVAGLPDKAIEATQAALALIPADPPSRLYLIGRYNLTLQLAEAGRPKEAAELLTADEGLYREHSEPWVQLRLLWVRAKIAALEEPDRALGLLARSREGFIAQGIGYDAAMVSLDMALIYLRQGRMAEIKELAEAMVAIFEAHDVHREAVAALILFQEAARALAVTASLLKSLRDYFRMARNDPSYPFRPKKD